MRRSRFAQEQIVGVPKQHEAGVGTAVLCRRHGIAARGRAGPRQPDPEGAPPNKRMTPAARRAAVRRVPEGFGRSVRRAHRLVWIGIPTMWYRGREPTNGACGNAHGALAAEPPLPVAAAPRPTAAEVGRREPQVGRERLPSGGPGDAAAGSKRVARDARGADAGGRRSGVGSRGTGIRLRYADNVPPVLLVLTVMAAAPPTLSGCGPRGRGVAVAIGVRRTRRHPGGPAGPSRG